jgi:hypothetical protein
MLSYASVSADLVPLIRTHSRQIGPARSYTRGVLSASTTLSVSSRPLLSWVLTLAVIFFLPVIAWDIFTKEFATALRAVELTNLEWECLPATLAILYVHIVVNSFLYGQ